MYLESELQGAMREAYCLNQINANDKGSDYWDAAKLKFSGCSILEDPHFSASPFNLFLKIEILAKDQNKVEAMMVA